MTRVGWLLTILLSLLLIVGWYFLIFEPTSVEIDEVRAETETVQAQAALERQRAAELRVVRENAPEAEAALGAGRLLIPDDPAIPSLFRQLQQASDDAGVRLLSITPAAPVAVELGEQQVASIGVSVALQGSYFQIVDLARRIEDPSLTPRALRWDAASLGITDFPELSVSLSGQVFARAVDDLPVVEDPEPVEEDVPADGVDPEGDDAEPDESDPDEGTS